MSKVWENKVFSIFSDFILFVFLNFIWLFYFVSKLHWNSFAVASIVTKTIVFLFFWNLDFLFSLVKTRSKNSFPSQQVNVGFFFFNFTLFILFFLISYFPFPFPFCLLDRLFVSNHWRTWESFPQFIKGIVTNPKKMFL